MEAHLRSPLAVTERKLGMQTVSVGGWTALGSFIYVAVYYNSSFTMFCCCCCFHFLVETRLHSHSSYPTTLCILHFLEFFFSPCRLEGNIRSALCAETVEKAWSLVYVSAFSWFSRTSYSGVSYCTTMNSMVA